MEEIEGDEDEEEELDLTPAEIYKKAGLTLLAGTLLVAVFADPMVCVREDTYIVREDTYIVREDTYIATYKATYMATYRDTYIAT